MMKLTDLSHQPLLLLLTIIVVIILLAGIFRTIAPHISLGFGAYAHVGDVRGAISFETFENANQPTFTIITAKWCVHCKTAKPDFDKLKSNYNGKTKIMMVDSDEQADLVKQLGVKGFPTLRYYPNGLDGTFNEYTGDRTYDSMKSYLDKL